MHPTDSSAVLSGDGARRFSSKGRQGEALLDALSHELTQRREKNARYSLRAFARDLAMDHSSLSQVLRGQRRLGPALLARLGRSLGARDAELAMLATSGNTRLSKKILVLVSLPGFRPDSRWIAEVLGVDVDTINQTLSELARTGRLRMADRNRWVRGRTRRAAQAAKEK